MKFIFIVLIMLFAISCSKQISENSKPEQSENAKTPTKDKNQVELTGIAAVIPDHLEKANGIGIIVKGEKLLFHGEFETLPEKVIGKEIHVVGKKIQKN